MSEKKYILREFYSLCPDGYCDISLLTESEKKLKADGRTILSGILQKANVRNGNGRVYSKKILEREVENYQRMIRENRALGCIDHPIGDDDGTVVSLKDASHRILRTWWDGDDLYGSLLVLSSPSGQILESLLRDGVVLGISSRGLGSLKETPDGNQVQDDFQLICWDIVSDPSTPGALMMKESKQRSVSSYTKEDRINRLMNDILKRSGR